MIIVVTAVVRVERDGGYFLDILMLMNFRSTQTCIVSTLGLLKC